MFWTFASAVPVWTAFEVVTLWMMANHYIPTITFESNPVWFVVLMLIIPLFREIHFYLVHRLIHWPPLYRTVHSLHHKNANPGPWSGLAMHPVEHILYFSGVLIHWILPSHPIHVIFHLQHLAFAPGTRALRLRRGRDHRRLPRQDRRLLPLPPPQALRVQLRQRPDADRRLGRAPSTTARRKPRSASTSASWSGAKRMGKVK